MNCAITTATRQPIRPDTPKKIEAGLECLANSHHANPNPNLHRRVFRCARFLAEMMQYMLCGLPGTHYQIARV